MNVDFIVSRRLRISLLLAIILFAAVHMSGCATVEQWTDDHPEVVAGASIAALTVGGVMVAHVIAHGSGRTVVLQKPPEAPINVSCMPACAR